jgi:lipopolysaccharide heptosyltransferase I
VHIALVKLSALGDVIHALPVARALRKALPGATLSWIAEAREARLLRGHPDLDHVLVADTRGWRRAVLRPATAPAAWWEMRSLRADLRRLGIEAAVDLQGLIKSGLVTLATGARVRIGFARPHCREALNACFTTHRVVPPPEAAHVVEQYLALLRPLGVEPAGVEFRIPIRDEAERRMEAFLNARGLRAGERLVVLHPGAGRPDKQWPIAHFGVLAGRLAMSEGTRVCVVWGPGELPLAQAIVEAAGGRCVVAPPTDLDDLASLLRRSTLVVAADTGPLHLAAAVGTPALGLFGPTRAERNGPYGPRCRALQSPTGVMAGLDPAVALAAAVEMLAS